MKKRRISRESLFIPRGFVRLKKGNERSGEILKTEPSDIDGSVVDVILERFK